MKTKNEKQLVETLIKEAYYGYCATHAGTQVNILDIKKIYEAGRIAYKTGGVAGLVKAVVDKTNEVKVNR